MCVCVCVCRHQREHLLFALKEELQITTQELKKAQAELTETRQSEAVRGTQRKRKRGVDSSADGSLAPPLHVQTHAHTRRRSWRRWRACQRVHDPVTVAALVEHTHIHTHTHTRVKVLMPCHPHHKVFISLTCLCPSHDRD